MRRRRLASDGTRGGGHNAINFLAETVAAWQPLPLYGSTQCGRRCHPATLRPILCEEEVNSIGVVQFGLRGLVVSVALFLGLATAGETGEKWQKTPAGHDYQSSGFCCRVLPDGRLTQLRIDEYPVAREIYFRAICSREGGGKPFLVSQKDAHGETALVCNYGFGSGVPLGERRSPAVAARTPNRRGRRLSRKTAVTSSDISAELPAEAVLVRREQDNAVRLRKELVLGSEEHPRVAECSVALFLSPTEVRLEYVATLLVPLVAQSHIFLTHMRLQDETFAGRGVRAEFARAGPRLLLFPFEQTEAGNLKVSSLRKANVTMPNGHLLLEAGENTVLRLLDDPGWGGKFSAHAHVSVPWFHDPILHPAGTTSCWSIRLVMSSIMSEKER